MRWLPALVLASILLFAAPAMALGPVAAQSPLSENGDSAGQETLDAVDHELDRDDPGQVIRIEITATGDAEWTVESRYQLETDDDVESFESFAEAVADGSTDVDFDVDQLEPFVERAAADTDREMSIVDPAWDHRIETEDDEGLPATGVLEKTFTWESFAEVDGVRIHVGDAFEADGESLFDSLTDGQQLVIEPPANYGYESLPQAPTNGNLVWDGPHEFDDGELAITYLEGVISGGEHTLTVAVEDHEGTPIDGATVHLESAFGELSETSDADGVVTFSELPDGEYTVSIDHEGIVGEATVVIDGGDESITLTGEYVGHTIDAVVEDGDGSPLADATVTLAGTDEDRTATTDADGAVAFDGLADGEYTVTAEYDGDEAEETVVVDGGDEHVTLTIDGGFWLAGTAGLLLVFFVIAVLVAATVAYLRYIKPDARGESARESNATPAEETNRSPTVSYDETDGESSPTVDPDERSIDGTDMQTGAGDGAETGSVADTDSEVPHSEDGEASDGDSTDRANPADVENEPTGEPVDVELLSDEERILRLLRENNGRLKQATIVAETKWSDAKVSQLLSQMAEAGAVEKLRIGRENLITLPEIDPTEID